MVFGIDLDEPLSWTEAGWLVDGCISQLLLPDFDPTTK